MLTKRAKKVIIYKHSGNESPLKKKERCARVLELADKHVSEACVLRTYGFDSRFSHHLIGDKADVKITSAFLFFVSSIPSVSAAHLSINFSQTKNGEFFILHYLKTFPNVSLSNAQKSFQLSGYAAVPPSLFSQSSKTRVISQIGPSRQLRS